MKKLLLFLMCFSFQLSAMVDGDIDIGQDTGSKIIYRNIKEK